MSSRPMPARPVVTGAVMGSRLPGMAFGVAADLAVAAHLLGREYVHHGEVVALMRGAKIALRGADGARCRLEA